MIVTIRPASKKSKKKFVAEVNGKSVGFGAAGYSDYTIHKDKDRRQRYITRHAAREDWTKAGIRTAGFWSRWLLWNKPSIRESAKDIEKKFNISIKLLA